MLGKQWLNQYASTDMRGTAIERSQNRQRKLDGIVAWYFDHVMELLPLMLQAALLLLGCALSRYLWEVNVTVASVILGVTSSGVILYIFIVTAGTASESCPYQTPGSQALRYLQPKIWRIVHPAALVVVSAFRDAFGNSQIASTFSMTCHPELARDEPRSPPWIIVLAILSALSIDAYCLGRAMIQLSVTFPSGMYHLGSIIVASVAPFTRRVHNQLHGTSPTPKQRSNQQATVLDLRCISWMLQTSLEKVVHLSALKHLVTMMPLADFDPTLATDCFDALVSCTKLAVNNRTVVIVQGLEQLAAVSATCLFNIISHLLVSDPTSSVLEDVRQRYVKVFPGLVFFHGHQSFHIMNAIHWLFIRQLEDDSFPWKDYRPSAREHTIVAHTILRLAQS